MEEDFLNYLYQLSCFVGHPVCFSELLILREKRFTDCFQTIGVPKKYKFFELTFRKIFCSVKNNRFFSKVFSNKLFLVKNVFSNR